MNVSKGSLRIPPGVQHADVKIDAIIIIDSSRKSGYMFQSDFNNTPSANMGSSVWLVVVAGLWGATNPFIKRGSRGIEKLKSPTALGQFLAELWFLATNWKYMLPFLINLSGSVVYYITLATADLSLAVPITNSLTFIFTSISGRLLGEKMPSNMTLIGMGLVIAGVLLCIMDKV